MRPRTLVPLFLLFLASSALAQAPVADVTFKMVAQRPDIAGPSTTFRAGDTIVYTVYVRNTGPATAQNVFFDLDFPGEIFGNITGSNEFTCVKTKPVRCTAATLDVTNFDRQISVWTIGPKTAGDYTAFAAMHSDTPDTNPANNANVTVHFSVFNAPDLVVSLSLLPQRMQPRETRDVTININNRAPVDAAHDVRISLLGTNGAKVIAATVVDGNVNQGKNVSCTVTGGSGLCTEPVMASNEVVQLRVTLQAADRDDGGSSGLRVVATSAEPEFYPVDNTAETNTSLVRQFYVLNNSPDGPASLRSALLAADSACRTTPCRINFAIHDGGAVKSPWITIYTTTPLPPIHGFVEIDGTTQTAFGGDTNPNGPEIEIRGDLQKGGDAGFTIEAACEANIHGLAIGGFGGHAISFGSGGGATSCGAAVLGVPFTVSDNYIGLQPDGRTPAPNLRGIWCGDVAALTVSHNLIGGNRRSAIFASHKFTQMLVNNNRIGLTIDNQPAPNGASGIYVGTFSADIDDNEVANSGEFGIAVAREAGRVSIRRNRIHDNVLTAIDLGLDLETPNGDDSRSSLANKPVLTSATFDPVSGNTIVRGRIDTAPLSSIGPQYALEFFASKSLSPGGHAQAERYLGVLTPKTGHEDFEFRFRGDLTGQWITATSSRSFYNGFARPDPDQPPALRTSQVALQYSLYPEETSELSDPIQVH